MRLTKRDIRLVKDVALSQILSRDQIIKLGYFGSVTRLNTRVRGLLAESFLSVSSTPFFGQRLYMTGSAASSILDPRIVSLLVRRAPTPRFLQHALAVNETRVALLKSGCVDWRFELQLRHSFLWRGQTIDIRPDGMVRQNGIVTLLEVDMGHQNPKKFQEKLRAYEAFVESGESCAVWGTTDLAVLTMTTGKRRVATLSHHAPDSRWPTFSLTTFQDLGIQVVGGWS